MKVVADVMLIQWSAMCYGTTDSTAQTSDSSTNDHCQYLVKTMWNMVSCNTLRARFSKV